MKQLTMLITIAVATASPLAAQTNTESDETERVHRSVEGYTAGNERGAATSQQLKEQRTLAADVISKPRSSVAVTTLGEEWIYDGDAELYDDFDNDGYFRFISVRFDADTYRSSAWVYAMLFLSADGETWEHYYTTDDFLIEGTVPDDEYFVETELIAGYPPGLYDVLIELYDADFGTFEDEYGPNESSALSLLPIEDAEFDAAPVTIAVTSEHGGGGAMSLLFLPLLLAARRFARSTADTARGAT